jgi:hypothetical protein
MSISRILENQLVIMEALSQLLPSKNSAQIEITRATLETSKELVLRAKAERKPTVKELEEILNSEVDRTVTVNLDGSVTSGIHGFINNHEGIGIDQVTSFSLANGGTTSDPSLRGT